MRRARPLSRQLPVVVVGMLVAGAALAGCGPAGGDGAEPVAEPAPAVSIPGDLSMGVEGEPSRSRDAASSPSPADEGAEPAADAEQCAALQQAWSTTNRALVDLSPEHPRALVQSFRTAEHAMAAAEPPEDLSTAWGTMSDYLASVATAFEDVDEDDADAVSSAMAGAITADDTADATAAAQDVTAFLAASCTAR
ncbi:hypothetical protein M1843_04090 [Isoptericola sp. 4D.3]|jgi:hypothetical protein|uniref:Lipoprotein n=1 Tax=Isoptericola peretonis TaxID=2918523 RepID=A0ABT0J0C9_9MICO|nr:hypothetical protein [Isoptericola sp. 4D.3]